jgi:outer membrane protein assembly factor BamB
MSQPFEHHIFLSYSRKDLSEMQRIRDDLRAAGLTVWTDENLEPGTNAWEIAIAQAIRTAGCVVVILSPDAEQSQWVGRELAFAETFGIRIYPLLIRGDERTSIPFRLISHQWIDARRDYDRASRTLTVAVQGYVKDASQAAAESLPSSPIAPAITPLWTFQSQDEIRAAPVVYQDVVFVGSYDSNLYALQLGDGTRRWAFFTNGGIAASPAIDEQEGLVYIGSEDHELYAVDCLKGRIMWTFATRDRIRSAVRAAYGCVFFGSDDHKLYALIAKNGRFMWSFDAAAPIRSRPYVTTEGVFFGTENGQVFKLDLAGKHKWSTRMRKAVTSSPLIHEGDQVCYVGSQDGTLYDLDVLNGALNWRFRTDGPVISSPARDKGMVYFGSADGALYAVNVRDARQKWKFTTEKPIVSSPTIHNNRVYFGGTDHTFYCLDAMTGNLQWRFQAGGPITGAACIAGDTILFGSLDHKLYALPLNP